MRFVRETRQLVAEQSKLQPYDAPHRPTLLAPDIKQTTHGGCELVANLCCLLSKQNQVGKECWREKNTRTSTTMSASFMSQTGNLESWSRLQMDTGGKDDTQAFAGWQVTRRTGGGQSVVVCRCSSSTSWLQACRSPHLQVSGTRKLGRLFRWDAMDGWISVGAGGAPMPERDGRRESTQPTSHSQAAEAEAGAAAAAAETAVVGRTPLCVCVGER